ncbi:sterol desaturase family protein [Gimesia fumaroli]|uniref:Fatty acid hydroxylase superfamily protein n=1 Tax=Gimesia fumaroli TaxID=2527976 RepID=A0A518I8Q1_9PLAN|nr:sterol desaturase family protein [Gimesia fumaroli]QDV49470.1 Fatty acid hydroxylase superfamily protein [Gimesia fumaroli]
MFSELSGLQILSLAHRILPVLLLALFWSWESWFAFKPVASKIRYHHALHNIILAVLNALLLGLLFGVSVEFAAQWSHDNHWGLLNHLPLGAVGKTILAVVLLDAWTYCWHWMNHRIPFFWRFHRMHHSDPYMDVSTATRFHWGELIFSTLFRLLLIPLLGLEAWYLIVYGLLVFLSTQFHHANISIGKADRFFRWLFVSPDMHKIHHSQIPSETNSNYSTVFSIWDRLAGTYRMRNDLKNIHFGLPDFDQPQWQTLLGMWKTPFTRKKENGSARAASKKTTINQNDHH